MNSVFRILCSLQTLNRGLADARESPIRFPLHDTTGLFQGGERGEGEGEIPGNLLLTESFLIDTEEFLSKGYQSSQKSQETLSSNIAEFCQAISVTDFC